MHCSRTAVHRTLCFSVSPDRSFRRSCVIIMYWKCILFRGEDATVYARASRQESRARTKITNARIRSCVYRVPVCTGWRVRRTRRARARLRGTSARGSGSRANALISKAEINNNISETLRIDGVVPFLEYAAWLRKSYGLLNITSAFSSGTYLRKTLCRRVVFSKTSYTIGGLIIVVWFVKSVLLFCGSRF